MTASAAACWVAFWIVAISYFFIPLGVGLFRIWFRNYVGSGEAPTTEEWTWVSSFNNQ